MRHEESKLQQNCVHWFRLAYPQYAYCMFAVPNGGYRNAKEGSILKAEGVMAGVSDLILLLPRQGYGSLCLEMKTQTGAQRVSQKMWQEEVEKNGNKYAIVRDFDYFKSTIEWYLGESNGTGIDDARNHLSNLLYHKNV